MTVRLEDYWPGAVGQVVASVVERKGAVRDKDVGGNGGSEEGKPTTC